MSIFPAILFIGLVLVGLIAFLFLIYLQTQRDLKAILKTTQWLAVIYATVAGALTIVDVARLIFTREAPDSTLPISPWLPDGLKILPNNNGTGLENLHFNTITADATGIPLNAALLLAGSLLLSGIIQVSIALAFRALAHGQLKGLPFRPQFTRVTQSLAWLVLICGLMAPILEGFGTAILASESLIAWEVTDEMSSPPTASLDVFISFWPIGVFLMLYTLSAILDSGEQLQKNSEGLI